MVLDNAQKEALKSSGYAREQVVEIINSVIEKLQSKETNCTDSMFNELQSLRGLIEDSWKELGQTRPYEIGTKHIPSATDELDAVVSATEQATDTIMDACDIIQASCENMDPAVGELVETEITKIYEACSFQDITGQRIKKVTTLLGEIETRVEKMMKVFAGGAHTESLEPEEDQVVDGTVIEGPQLPENAISQDDIDKILAEFDA